MYAQYTTHSKYIFDISVGSILQSLYQKSSVHCTQVLPPPGEMSVKQWSDSLANQDVITIDTIYWQFGLYKDKALDDFTIKNIYIFKPWLKRRKYT